MHTDHQRLPTFLGRAKFNSPLSSQSSLNPTIQPRSLRSCFRLGLRLVPEVLSWQTNICLITPAGRLIKSFSSLFPFFPSRKQRLCWLARVRIWDSTRGQSARTRVLEHCRYMSRLGQRSSKSLAREPQRLSLKRFLSCSGSLFQRAASSVPVSVLKPDLRVFTLILAFYTRLAFPFISSSQSLHAPRPRFMVVDRVI
jgi:hypothetical protein